MAFEEIKLWITEDDVAVIVLNAPDRRNALGFAMVDEIVAAVAEAEQSAGALVITGTPPAFCAGAMLDTLIEADEASLTRIYDGFLAVARSPLPSVAAVNGHAVGAGVNLALCCDVRITADKARWIARFAGLGITPGGGHTWMLQRAVGRQGTMALNMFGDELVGAEAVTAGLAWRSMEADAVVPTAIEMAARAAATPAYLRERLTTVVDETAQLDDHSAAVAAELVHQAEMLRTDEARRLIAETQARISKS